jgi:LytS/YehU family sensor histidine kinase
MLFRYYLYDLKYLGYTSTYLIRLQNQLYFLPFSIFFAYFSLYYLLPRFINTRKYLQVVLFVLAIMGLQLLLSYLISRYLDIKLAWDIPLAREPLVRKLDFTISNGLVYPLQVSTFAIGIKMAKNFYLKQREHEQLLRQRISSEIRLLKAQIHPRFIFHALEAIYQDTRNGFVKSPAMLLTLSDLLSYILYESDRNEVPLEEELTMVEDYLRLERSNDIRELNVEISNNVPKRRFTIAPLILLPILECVFEQFSQQKDGENLLNLNLSASGTEFSFVLRLVTDPPMNLDHLSSNPRLTQIRKHLKSQYPEDHLFSIEYGWEVLTVNLKIRLREISTIAQEPSNKASFAI